MGAARHDTGEGRHTVVTRMANLVLQTAVQLGFPCHVTLDAYFAVGPAFLIFGDAVNEKGEQLVHLITRAKSNYVGYVVPGDDSRKKFREDDKVRLREVFDSPGQFGETEVTTDGNVRTVRRLVRDLLWKPVGAVIRFVFVIDGDDRHILMCSDLTVFA